MPDGVVIKISGDASNFEQTLKGTERTAKSAAGALGAEYKKAGMEMSAAMQKAWKEVQAAQKSGSTIKINGVDTIISESKQAQKSIKSIGDSAEKAADDVGKASGRMASGLKEVKSAASNISSGISSVASGIAKGVGVVSKWASLLWGVAGVATVKYTSDIEQLQTSFEVMTGSADKAAQVIDRIRTMGAETPFEMGDLAETTQLLMNYGLTADDALSKMSMLGDIAQGNADKMQSIATAYGQMSSAGKVSLEDVKQMIEAGFNPLHIISEKTGESMASLYERISKGTLAVSEITAAMQAATSEGGKYYQSMEKQSQTISGMFSTLKDNLQQLGGDLFAPFTDSLRTTILPGTISIIDEISAAFKARGVDGIISVINQQTPKLIDAAGKLAKKAIDGLKQKFPSLLKGLLNSLPSLLSTSGELLPGIAELLFDGVAQAVEYVAGNLPELVPLLLKGLGNLALSLADGFLNVLGSAFSGIGTSLKKLGLMDYNINDLMDNILSNVDKDRVETMRAAFKAEVDVSEAKTAIQTAADELDAALSGFGLSDDQVAAIEEMIGQDYAAIYAKCKEFGLDDTAASEIATKVTTLNSTISEKLSGLSVAIDVPTLANLFKEADGNKTKLINTLQRMGLTDADIATVTSIFDDVEGKLSERIPSLQQAIVDALTDGEADTPEVVSGLQESVNGMFEEAFAGVDETVNAQIAMLDPEAPDFATACANIQANAQATKDELTTLQSAIQEWIASAAGKSTAEVQARVGELEQLMAQVLGITAQIEEANGRLNGRSAQAYRAVVAGATTDEESIGMALKLKFEEFKVDEQSFRDAYAQKIAEIQADDTLSADKAKELELAAKANLDLQLAENQAQYQAQLAAIFQGIAEAMPDDVAQPIQEAVEKLNLAASISEWIENGVENGPAPEGAEALIKSVFGENYDYKSAIENGFGGQFATELGAAIFDIQNEATQLLANTDFSTLGDTLELAISEGLFDGTEFEGMEDQAQQLIMLLGMAFSNADLNPEVTAEPKVDVDNPEVDASGVTEEVTQATQEAADSTEPVETTQQVNATAEINTTTADDSGIEEAVNAELATQTMNVGVNAAVSLNVTVSDSNAATVGTTVGQQIGDAIAEGVSSKSEAVSTAATTLGNSAASGARAAYDQMKSAGSYAGQGFQLGLASKRTAILQTARGIANSVASVIKMALDINSPSGVTMALGAYTGEGFDIGLSRSLNKAVRNAEHIVSTMNLAPRMSYPDIEGALSTAASGAYSAEASRPIYLAVNGRILAQAISRDTRIAGNSYNRSVALGVGK